MKIIKKAPKIRGICERCKTEYLLSPKDLRDAIYYNGKTWAMCKLCKRKDVEVMPND